MADERGDAKNERIMPMHPLDVIANAIRAIDPGQVDHPSLGVQERPLCYELYHKLRSLEELGVARFAPARTQAELNKSGQHLFRQTIASRCRLQGRELDWKVSESIPDLLVHHPGTDGDNLAVLEVKRHDAKEPEILWDLAKLALFRGEILHYAFSVFLVFNDQGCDPGAALERVQRLGTPGGELIHAFSYDVHRGELAAGTLHFSVDRAHEMLEAEARYREERRLRKQQHDAAGEEAD